MQICSYIVYHDPSDRDTLLSDLSHIPGCETQPAADGLMVLITETHGSEQEQQLQDSLQALSGIGCLVQAFGTIAEEA